MVFLIRAKAYLACMDRTLNLFELRRITALVIFLKHPLVLGIRTDRGQVREAAILLSMKETFFDPAQN